MYHVSAQGVDERMINVHYYYLGRGEGGREVGEGGDYIYIYIYLSLHCHHQNDSCIKMGNDVSHFNVL